LVIWKLQQQSEYLLQVGPLLLIVILGARAAFRQGMRAPVLYLGFALAVFLMTCGKVGADTNYRVESSAVALICAGCALHALDFFALYFRQSKNWVTLLILGVAVYAAYNVRISVFGLVERVARERLLAAQSEIVKPYLHIDGRVLSADHNV